MSRNALPSLVNTQYISIRKHYIKHASVGAEIIHWYEKELQKVKKTAFEGILG